VRWLTAVVALPLLLIAELAPARAQGYDTSGAPDELPYRKGDNVPPGYHLEHGARDGIVAAGLVLFGLGYGGAVAVGASDGFQNKKGYLLVPIFGPAFLLDKRSWKNDGEATPGFLIFGAVMDGGVQGAGLLFALREVVQPQTRLVRDTALRLSVSPAFARDFFGLSLTGQF
jgi:hypothetical protein